jgi:PAS domain S-box-containing protein
VTSSEDALRQSEAVKSAVLDLSLDAVVMIDHRGLVVEFSAAAERLFQYRRADVIGRRMADLMIPPGLREAHRRGLERYLDTGETRVLGRRIEIDAMRSDGSTFPTELAIMTLPGSQPPYFVGFLRDITERRRADEALRRLANDSSAARHRAEESGRRIRLLSDASALLVSSLDYDTTLASVARSVVPELADWCSVDILEKDGALRQLAVAHANPAKVNWARQLRRRYPPDLSATRGLANVLRTRVSELYSSIPEDLLAASARDAEHLALMRAIGFASAMIVPLVSRDSVLGAMTFVSAESGRRYTADDLALAEELAQRAAVAVDNARLFREAQDARALSESANRSKSEFLAAMSHEIRTPINAMIGYTQLLEMGVAGPYSEEQGVQLARIGASGKHLLGLIDDVLDLSRIEAGRLTVSKAPGVAGSAVDTVLALVRPQAAEKGIALDIDCGGTRDAEYVGDERRVQQILANLLSNAVKFTPPAGRVRVECGRAEQVPADAETAGRGPWTYFAVEDTGIGIAPAMLHRIFQPFVQGEGGYTRAHGGTGLGLTLSRRLARLMDGDLTAESVQGEGSRFVLWLPEAPSTPALERQATPAEDALRRTRADAEVTYDAEVAGALTHLGSALLEDLNEIVRRFVANLRADPEALPKVERLTDRQLEDHVQTWLTDVAQALIILATARGEPSDLMRDGTEIQRTVAERHGAQRHRLGWDEAALAREFASLRAAIDDTLAARGWPRDGTTGARGILAGFIRQAEEISRRGLRNSARTATASH